MCGRQHLSQNKYDSAKHCCYLYFPLRVADLMIKEKLKKLEVLIKMLWNYNHSYLCWQQ